MAFTFLAWVPWALNAMITFRSATPQRRQVEHTALPDWAGHSRTLLPSGVLRGTGWSLGITTTAGRPKETAWSASLNDSVLALIVNPCSLLRFRIGILCLLSVWCVYVYPLRFVLETTSWAIIPWSISPNWCGRSPAWLCLHIWPSGSAWTKSQRPCQSVPRSPLLTLRQWRASGPDFA